MVETNLYRMVSVKYFEMVLHEVDHILLLVTMPVQLINKTQCCYQIHGIIERIQFERPDIAQYRLAGPDNTPKFQAIHSHIVEVCMSKQFKIKRCTAMYYSAIFTLGIACIKVFVN